MVHLRLLPPLIWTAMIAWFSTDTWSGEQTESLLFPWLQAILPWASPDLIVTAHWVVRKLAHVAEYGILAALWRWAAAIWSPRRAGGWALGLSLLTASLDEAHQATTSTRGGSPLDVLIDGVGIGLVLLVVGRGAGRALDGVTTLVLWIAAAGGTLLLLLSLAAEVPGGLLWITTPAAWLALWLRRSV
jgi:VanZ family protein